MLNVVFTLAERDRRDVVVAAHEVAEGWRASPFHHDPDVRLVFELRIDALTDPTHGPALAYDIPGPVIATLRGEQDGTRRARILEDCRRCGARWIDSEIGVDEPPPGIDAIRSVHATGSFIGDEALRALEEHGDVLKVATRVRTFPHLTRLERFRRARRGPRAIMGLGELGRVSRWRVIAASNEGDDFVYAAARRAVDPGQLARVDLLRHAPRVRAGGRIFGLIGAETSASLSPAGFNASFAAAEIPAVYTTFPLRRLDGLARAARELGCGGFSVTAPHKSAVMEHLETISAEAAAVGAVNTVGVAADGALHGANTDVVGIRRALADVLDGGGLRVLVVGAGGAARAALHVCREAGARIDVLARDPGRAAECARAFGAELVTSESLRRGAYALVINASPVGGPTRPGRTPVPPRVFDAETVAFDMNYRPTITPMLERARERGARIVSGLEMFVHQARGQWEFFCPEHAAGADVLEEAIRAAAKEEG